MNSSATNLDWGESPSARDQSLKHTGNVFQSLFERSADAIWLLDPQAGVFVDCNQAAVELIGAESKQQLLNKRPEDLSPSYQPDGSRSADKSAEIMAIIERQRTFRFEWVIRRFDGKEVPLEASSTAVLMGGERINIVISRDISERKKAERQLLELTQALERRVNERTAEFSASEAKFRALFEGASQGVVLHDESQVLEVNPAAVRILGRRSAHEMLGRHPGEFSPPVQPSGESSDALARKHIEECMTKGSARFDWLACDPDGREIFLEVNLTLIEWSGREVIQAFISDITERKRAEAALAESEARFSAAFRASPVFITISRMDDGRYVLANEAYLNWTGYRLDEILGRTSRELGLWADPADREPFWEELRRTRSIHERECRLRDRHGKLFTMLISADIIEINRVPHLLTVGLDVSQRKRVEGELHRTLAREKELSQLKSNFVSMVSHEFRTPLGIIQSSAELLREFYQKMPPGEREDHLESISRNARRMAGMMEEVLVLSRLDAGKLDFQPGALDLNLFCRRMVDEVLSATNRRCPIALSLNSIPTEAQADERLLGHIFTNLLSNAVKYSEPGATVHFLVERQGRDAVCVIRDTGIGISEDDQQQLFKAFHRGSNVGTRPGTGLGLLLVKRCAELHGGKVQLHSKIGEGTAVTVRLKVF
ncbi:MAG: PAS domain-containing sensor histidine kinase [Verrucomicrobia bacterium]|nr:PAS domain-containing sensor histidine kinase [Verrucomicrobiota bacterium]